MCSLASRPYTWVEIGNLFVTQEQSYELKKALRLVKGDRSRYYLHSSLSHCHVLRDEKQTGF
jgi:hypothetical protein